MRKSYRLAQEQIYKDALKSVKVQVKKVTAHKDGSATVPTTEKATTAIKTLPGVEILVDGSTEITFRIPAAVEYHNGNPPNFTQEQREQQAAEKAERKAVRAAKKASAQVSDDGDEAAVLDGEPGEEEAGE